MKVLFEFFKLPLSLPIAPIWDYLICTIIGEFAYRIAFYSAGMRENTRGERKLFHWLIRIPLYLAVWFAACIFIIIVRFTVENWIVVLAAVSIIAVLFVSIIVIQMKR